MRNVYSRLFKYRMREKRAPLEDYLTEALADLVDRMPADVSADLFATMLEPTGRHGRWREAVLASKRSCSTQVVVEGGIVDLVVLLAGRPAIVVESKIGSSIRIHEDGEEQGGHQLRTYDRWLSRERKVDGPAALILLTHNTRPPPDFSDDSAYGTADRAVFTWGALARWLRRHSGEAVTGTAWSDLAADLHAFLEEQGMSNDTVTPSDISATQLFLPAWQRWTNTFGLLWEATKETRSGVLGKPKELEIENDGNVIWQWAYCLSPRPTEWWVAFVVRFPDASNWWHASPLPRHPHIALLIGTDDEGGTLVAPKPLPSGWLEVEAQFVTAKPLAELPSHPDEMAAALSAWATSAMSDARAIVETLGTN